MQELTIAAFSMEMRSAGSPSFFHSAISASSAKTSKGVTVEVKGMFCFNKSAFHAPYKKKYNTLTCKHARTTRAQNGRQTAPNRDFTCDSGSSCSIA